MACNGSCRWRWWKAAGRWEAVMRLGNTEAADDTDRVWCTHAMFWARAGEAAKGGESVLAKI